MLNHSKLLMTHCVILASLLIPGVGWADCKPTDKAVTTELMSEMATRLYFTHNTKPVSDTELERHLANTASGKAQALCNRDRLKLVSCYVAIGPNNGLDLSQAVSSLKSGESPTLTACCNKGSSGAQKDCFSVGADLNEVLEHASKMEAAVAAGTSPSPPSCTSDESEKPCETPPLEQAAGYYRQQLAKLFEEAQEIGSTVGTSVKDQLMKMDLGHLALILNTMSPENIRTAFGSYLAFQLAVRTYKVSIAPRFSKSKTPEEGPQVDLGELLKRAEKRFKETDQKTAAVLEPLIKELKAEINERKKKKTPEGMQLANVFQGRTYGANPGGFAGQGFQGMNMAGLASISTTAHSAQPISSGLLETVKKIERILTLPIKTTPINISATSESCKKSFETRPEVLQKKALSLASQIANHEADPETFPTELTLFTGEPGNGKTTSIELLGECTGAGVCKISHDELRTKLDKASSYEEVKKGLQELIADCYAQGKQGKNKLLLFDDFDAAFADLKNSETLMGHAIRYLTDLINNPEFEDPKSGAPIDTSRSFTFMTANSVPPGWGVGDEHSKGAFKSRLSHFEVPYLSYAERANLIDLRVKTFFTRSGGSLDHSTCKLKVQEIKDFDNTQAKIYEGHLGVRGLEKLLVRFYAHMNSQGGANPCQGFDVQLSGADIQDYWKSLSPLLLDAHVKRQIQIFKSHYNAIKGNLSTGTNEAIDATLRLVQSSTHTGYSQYSHSDPYGRPVQPAERKQPDPTLEEVLKSKKHLESAISLLAFEKGRTQGDSKAIGRRFKEAFSYVDVALQKSLLAIADKIVGKWQKKAKDPGRNRAVLVELTGEVPDLGLLYQLPSVLGAPSCHESFRREPPPQTRKIPSQRPSGWDRSDPLMDMTTVLPPPMPMREQTAGLDYLPPPPTMSLNQLAQALPGISSTWERQLGALILDCLDSLEMHPNRSQAVIILDISGEGEPDLKQLSEAIQRKLNDRTASRDLRHLTVVMVPDQKLASEALNFKASDDSGPLRLKLPDVEPEKRGNLIRAFIGDACKKMAASTQKEKVELNEAENLLLKRLIDEDLDRAKKLKMTGKELPLEPLYGVARAILDEVSAREERIIEYDVPHEKEDLFDAWIRLHYDQHPPS